VNDAFIEKYNQDDHDALERVSADFDWEGLYAHLDADSRNGGNDPRLAEAVARLLQMFLPLDGKSVRPQTVGLRVIALAWVLSPGYFEGSPSLTELSERCDVGAATLAQFTGEFSRLIGWRNRSQQRGWNWHPSERRPLGKGSDVAAAPPGKCDASAG
jgi:hypothetical protein